MDVLKIVLIVVLLLALTACVEEEERVIHTTIYHMSCYSDGVLVLDEDIVQLNLVIYTYPELLSISRSKYMECVTLETDREVDILFEDVYRK